MTPAELVEGLARAVREAVRPRLGQGREVVGTAHSGDITFALDEVAEAAVEAYLAECDMSVATFSEDRGLVGPVDAEHLLVVDPIDGTRPAKAGLECCCVSVALAPNRPGATLGDVTDAAVYELKADRLFVASRGGGVRIVEAGRRIEPAPTPRTSVVGAAMCFEITGRPLLPTATVLAELVDGASLRGGVFSFASSTYGLTRLVLGWIELHVDVADRIRRDLPELEADCRAAGEGRLIALFVYDLAGVALVAKEAGVVVTDAYGRSLDAVPLTDVSEAWHCSLVAAGNAALHAAAMAAVERGMRRLESVRRGVTG